MNTFRKIKALALAAVVISLCCFIGVYGRAMAKSGHCLAAQSEKKIYLTFDDGPSATITPKVQKVLNKHGVKATFFVVVSQAEQHPELVKSLHRQGHTIAVHCYNHDYKKIYRSAISFEMDLRRAIHGLKTIIPEIKCGVMRFPGGSFTLSEKYIDVVQKLGMQYVDWNSTNGDTLKEISSAESSFEYAVSTSAGRDKIVMLMHDNKSLTLGSLEKIITHFKQEGYVFCTF